LKLLVPIFFGLASLTALGADLPPLNSPPAAAYYQGKFVWADLFTTEPSVAKEFYTRLLGWTATEVDRTSSSGVHPYYIFSVDDRPIAGIALRLAHDKDVEHGKWVGFVSVPDVAKALALASAGGGRVLSRAKGRPDRGIQAIFDDPEGATLGVIHSSSGDPGEFLPENGEWTWAELFSRDPDKAVQFYHAVIGYGQVQDTRSGRSNDFVLVSGGYSRASVTVLSNRPKARPAWLLFVRVASIKDSVARAVSLGGRVLLPPSDSPSGNWRAVIADPTGAYIGLVELGQAPAAGENP
jgi:predicted enzyme related to lactoylglutathione lyase